MSNKTAGRLTGIAFIIASAAGATSLSFIGVAQSENYMSEIAANPNGLTVGALLVLLMAMACSAIAYGVYPVLSKHSKYLAIGAAGFRTIEGAVFAVSSATLLTLIPLAQAGADGAQILALHEVVGVGATMAFICGASLYNIGFFKYKLVPRWLSIWGIIALLMHMVQTVLTLYGMDAFSPIGLVMNMPIAVQEMVMAVYLIIWGFKKSET